MELLSELTDFELLEEIKSGNMAAFRTLYYRHVDGVFGLVTRILGPGRADREDVVQEVFFQAHRSLGRFEGRSSVSTWLHRIAVNVAYSHLRHHTDKASLTSGELPAIQSAGDGERRVDARRAVQRMYALLDELSPKSRLVFTLYEFEGMTLERISDVLDIPLHTAASRLRRSRERLMQAMLPTVVSDEGKGDR